MSDLHRSPTVTREPHSGRAHLVEML